MNLFMPIRAEPFAHQRAAYAAALEMFESEKSRGYALLMEMGLGKSMTAIATAGALYQAGKIRRVLIVAPLSILGVWDEEFAKFANFDYTIAILSGSGAKKADMLWHLAGSPLQVAVVNYESAWRLEKEIAAWLKGSGSGSNNGAKARIGTGANVAVSAGTGSNISSGSGTGASTSTSLIIADEGHKIKTHSANASKAMHRLGALAGYRLLLTGTVITNKAIDVFSQYKYLNPAVFGNSFYSWRNRYFDMTGYGQHTPILKRSMESELTRKLHSIAYRATKAECLDLPETTDIIRYVDLEPTAMKLYRDLVKDSYTQLQNGDEVSTTNILTRLLRLSQLTGGFLGGDENPKPQSVSKAKIDALSDIIDEAQQEGRKLVIIARFVAEIAAIKALLDKQGIFYSAISGETKDRAEQVSAFQTDPNVTVFIGQIATAGLGITLTAATTLVFYSLDYSMSNFEQAKARIHRVGQKQSCAYIYLTARGTVDEKVLKALRDKADLARTLVDDCRRGANPFS